MCSEYLLAPSLLLFRTPCQAAQAPPPPPAPRPAPPQYRLGSGFWSWNSGAI